MKSLVQGLLLLLLTAPLQAAEQIHLFAASSLTTVMDRLAAQYQQTTGTKVVTTYAASSALARQIYQGAPADIYLSANQRWMDYLEQQAMIQPQSRKTLVQNSLALIRPADGDTQPEPLPILTDEWPLAEQLAGQRLAVADPDHVPAGIYAREALENLKLWPAVRGHLARSHNVRGALALVEQGEATLGMVYRTDAMASEKVTITAEVPTSSHSAIEYPVAMIQGADPATADFYRFLSSPATTALLQEHGFRIPAPVKP